MRSKKPFKVVCYAVVSILFLALVDFSVASSISVVHPRNGAILPPSKYTLIGKIDGVRGGKVKIYVGKKKYFFKLNGNGVFFGEIKLDKTARVTIVSPDGETTKVSYKVRSGTEYWKHLDEAGCGDCHAGDMSVQFPEDLNCYSCHERKDDKEYVHGPIGGGACSICHDPHGSGRKFLLRADVREMCVSCHDQESSRKHIDSARNKRCNGCHNPHGGNNQFFLEKGK